MEEAQVVCELIKDKLGEEAAHNWLWSCTPFPFGKPSEKQLLEGIAVSKGELDLNNLICSIEEDMIRQMREYREEQKEKGKDNEG